MQELCEDILKSARGFKEALVYSGSADLLVELAVTYLKEREDFKITTRFASDHHATHYLDLHETAIIFAQDTRLLRGINCDVVYVDKDSFTNDEDGIVDTVVALAFANRKIFMINRTVGGEGDETKYELYLLNPYSETALEQ
jgi:hypothetical protein